MSSKKHNEELKPIAPILSSIEKRELHKCPEGYFDNLAQNVLAQLNEAPTLYSLEKKELTEIPAGYFDSVDVRIKNIAGSKKQAVIVPIRKKVLWWSAVAAGICLLAIGNYVFRGDEKKVAVASVTHTNAKINTNTAYTNYLVDELHEDDLIAYVSEQETEKDSSVVVDYLMENGVDLETE